MAASSHAQPPEQTFVSGRSPPLVIYFTRYSHPASCVPVHSSPEAESQLSRSVVPQSGYGAQKVLPLPTPQNAANFVVDFSTDGILAVAARQGDNAVIVLKLKSGDSRLTIDASMKIYGLRVIGNTVTVIGDRKVVAWDLPTGDHIPDAKVTLLDSSRAIDLGGLPRGPATSASISPDSCYIVVSTAFPLLENDNGSTAESLARSVVGISNMSTGESPTQSAANAYEGSTGDSPTHRIVGICSGSTGESVTHSVVWQGTLVRSGWTRSLACQ